jgi:hypothetical protein
MPSLVDVSQACEEMVILLQHLGHLGIRDGVWLHPGSCNEGENRRNFEMTISSGFMLDKKDLVINDPIIQTMLWIGIVLMPIRIRLQF